MTIANKRRKMNESGNVKHKLEMNVTAVHIWWNQYDWRDIAAWLGRVTDKMVRICSGGRQGIYRQKIYSLYNILFVGPVDGQLKIACSGGGAYPRFLLLRGLH
ncbi:hypothetical protein T11_15341 [Trichinella zimbabwensis]|uniref:Uncharacterized protein n=1 Tax=Trichinella zimbabwensis TaxID=268475 RepID=A0A0V1HVL3_9BILA|nr:hypothetical protein T11_15341 [Trichinella zimbabwensis]